MEVHRETLTQLQYTDQLTGSLKLYRIGPDGYHTGGIWFSKKIRYPDEEISIELAKRLANEHMKQGLEVRICNGGDMLVFQARGSEVIHPKEGAEFFWRQVESS